MNKDIKFAVVLSGSGVFDGAEIHEATLTLYAIDKNKASYEIFAPNIQQHHVINHITGKEMEETRNVLIESARIARGNIKDLASFDADQFDAIIFPGGFGAAKNLSSLAFEGPTCTVNKEVEIAVKDMYSKNKPIGALCIAPAIIVRILGNIEVTIGQDEGTVQAIETMGGKHLSTDHEEIIVDNKNKIVTTPCYMLDASISQIGEGAENVVKEIIKLTSS